MMDVIFPVAVLTKFSLFRNITQNSTVLCEPVKPKVNTSITISGERIELQSLHKNNCDIWHSGFTIGLL